MNIHKAGFKYTVFQVMPDEEVDEVNEPLSSFDGVEVATEWTMWTGCNRCGTVAERRRYGNCAVVVKSF